MAEEKGHKDEKKPGKKREEDQTIKRPTNCMNCNKRLKKKYWYYRNNGYYCSKGCWKQAQQKLKSKAEQKKA